MLEVGHRLRRRGLVRVALLLVVDLVDEAADVDRVREHHFVVARVPVAREALPALDARLIGQCRADLSLQEALRLDLRLVVAAVVACRRDALADRLLITDEVFAIGL